MRLDKIRVSESIKTATKTPSSRRWVYQCRCWFALASGYDWNSLGEEGKITWTVITNKSGAWQTKEILYRGVIFLGEFSHCGYKENSMKFGKIVLIVWIWEEKKCSINGKIWQSFLQTTKLKIKKRKKKHW